MPIMFNTILREAGLPLSDVRLIRHKDNQAERGRTPYELWRYNRPQFEDYQSRQRFSKHVRLKAPYWAVFVANPSKETMFVGLYAVKYLGPLERDTPMVQKDDIDKAGSCDVYELTLRDTLSEFIGKLFIDWGPGYKQWVQRADYRDKPITKLRREFQESAFHDFSDSSQMLSTPTSGKVQSLDEYKVSLEKAIAKSEADSHEERLRRLEIAPKKPDLIPVTTTDFKRNPDVIAEVRKRANGVCEGCNNVAPFPRKKDGSPYLEVHHIVMLSDGGDDTVQNALALCPNCHRKAHYG